MGMSIPVVIVSFVLFFILFFGLGFILNMLFRKTWIMAVIYPLVSLYFINSLKVREYFVNPSSSFQLLKEHLLNLAIADTIILCGGLAGSILSGIVIRILRSKGYRMF
jgi:hypothetical protein